MKLLAACSHELFMSAESVKIRDINFALCAGGSRTTTVAFIKLKPFILGWLL